MATALVFKTFDRPRSIRIYNFICQHAEHITWIVVIMSANRTRVRVWWWWWWWCCFNENEINKHPNQIENRDRTQREEKCAITAVFYRSPNILPYLMHRKRSKASISIALLHRKYTTIAFMLWTGFFSHRVRLCVRESVFAIILSIIIEVILL